MILDVFDNTDSKIKINKLKKLLNIEDDASIRLLRPSQKTFVILFNQTNGSINDFHIVFPKIFPCFPHKSRELISWHVNFRDDFGRWLGRTQSLIQNLMIAVPVIAQLVRVGPINLPRRGQIITSVFFKHPATICMSEHEQCHPVVGA